MIDINKLNTSLNKVEKPARYIGDELNTIIKPVKDDEVSFAFCFPDVYEVGMSHMGTQILYFLMNQMENVRCERSFAPWPDMERLMRETQLPLYTLENKIALSDYDLVGFTLQYELCYSNLLNMLDLSGIPLRSAERTEGMPFVVAGGPCAYNPEPLASIVDIFILGEGEEVNLQVVERFKDLKHSGLSRRDILVDLASLEGVYIPSLYEITYDDDGKIATRKTLDERAPERINKRYISNFEDAFHLETQIVPFIEVVHDRAVAELFRGCTQGCRFCQAGMIYRPIRERSPESIIDSTRQVLASTGYEEVSLSSLSTCDYPELRPLVSEMMEEFETSKVGISLPSLRLDSDSLDVLKEVEKVRKTGLTFAPEAGSQRMRDVINKNITEADLERALRFAFHEGYSTIKLYFMIGLPTETDEDLEGIKRLAYKAKQLFFDQPPEVRRGNLKITASASCFVPKPFTPFQWVGQTSVDELTRRAVYIKSLIGDPKVRFTYHEPNTSYMEAVFARGDRRLSEVLIRAFEKGAKFDGWEEYFKIDLWRAALEECGLNGDFYATRTRETDEILPWDFIDIGVTKEFLIREYHKSIAETTTRDCRQHCVNCGINADYKGEYCP